MMKDLLLLLVQEKSMKAYPFAIQTAYHLNELDKIGEGSKKKKEAFIRAQKYLESEFSPVKVNQNKGVF